MSSPLKYGKTLAKNTIYWPLTFSFVLASHFLTNKSEDFYFLPPKDITLKNGCRIFNEYETNLNFIPRLPLRLTFHRRKGDVQ